MPCLSTGHCSIVVQLGGAKQGNSNGSMSITAIDSDNVKLLSTSAAYEVQMIVGLDQLELEELSQELQQDDEDLILVLKLNPIWIGMYSQAMADEVLDLIATWGMDNPTLQVNRQRRGHPWICHFAYLADMSDCRQATLADHPIAFALSPEAIAMGAIGVGTNPLAFSAIVHKLGVHQDDVEPFNFFYV